MCTMIFFCEYVNTGCYQHNSPFRLVNFLKKVKHDKDDGKNFTEQSQTIRFTAVLCWVVLC